MIIHSKFLGFRVSCDILQCFPRLVCESVFQHLNAKELLEVSKVNRRWYEFVGERPQIGKVKLIFSRKKELTNEVEDILKKSTRKYQNIELDDISLVKSEFVLSFLAERTGLWKFVAIKLCEVARNTLPEILAIIEPWIEQLSVTRIFQSYSEKQVLARKRTFEKLVREDMRNHRRLWLKWD